MRDGKSLADLAQFLSETNLFFGLIYDDHFPSTFAKSFVEDLVGDHTSPDNKTWVTNFIIDKMTAGATQAEVVPEAIQALSAIPASDPNWGEAATYHTTRIAVKVVSKLTGNTITVDEAKPVVDYILEQMAAGQTVDAMVEWARTVEL